MAAWTPSKMWVGQDAYVIGGGASLLGFDFNLLKGKNTVGCNDAYRLGSDVVKVVLFSDAAWFQKNKWALEQFQGLVVSCAPTLLAINVPWLKVMARETNGLYTGSTLGWNYSTGAAAINLALSLGAEKVYLLGMDLAQDKGKTHWHKHRPKLTSEDAFTRFRRGFVCVHRHLKDQGRADDVILVTDGVSTIPYFPRKTFAEAFSTSSEDAGAMVYAPVPGKSLLPVNASDCNELLTAGVPA